jgi:hypothetical protein
MNREIFTLWLLGAITIVCMGYTLVVPFIHPDNPGLASTSLEVATFVFKAGFAFFVGLITGTAAAKNRSRR